MRLALQRHPDQRSSAAQQIEVDVARSRLGRLTLHYLVRGTIGDVRLSPISAPARTDELWKHTCFEAFVRAAPATPQYYEFNFSPSTQWAAYRFTSYRSGMSAVSEIGGPRVDVQSSPAQYELKATLDLDTLPDLPSDAAWRLALSAIIEEKSGHKSYWALVHPPGKADFHHPDCFAHPLARP
jgi:hypothetical protein